MANKTQIIRIESVLGGESQFRGFYSSDQFNNSLGVDPYKSVSESLPDFFKFSGYIRPSSTVKVANTDNFSGAPYWIVTNPKNTNIFVYDTAGSTYSMNGALTSVVGLGDLNDGGTASGNGSAYYDNYVYFSRDTTISRYGPLDGSPTFTDDYWTNTLGKTALTNSEYPYVVTDSNTFELPNHVLHRHVSGDGALYVCDVVGGQGAIHKIKTRKTSVEGDTDDGSTYNVLDLPYGWYPTAIESYGDSLVISVFEGTKQITTLQSRPKIIFWDTTSPSPNSIVEYGLADSVITAMKNINGVLYLFSGQQGGSGVRISRYVGGSSFEEVSRFFDGNPPIQSGVVSDGARLYFGGSIDYPEGKGCVYAIGGPGRPLDGVFKVATPTNSTSSTYVFALAMVEEDGYHALQPIFGWSDEASGVSGIDENAASDFSKTTPFFTSQYYKIGQRFKLTQLTLNFGSAISANHAMHIAVNVDHESTTFEYNTGFPEINSTNYNGLRYVVLKPRAAITGTHGFEIKFSWSGVSPLTVLLPITIEYELIDD